MGWQLHQNIGIDIGLSYLRGSAITRSVETFDFKTVEELRGQMFRLSPELKVKLGFQRIRAYTHLGFIIGIRPSIKSVVNSTDGTNESYSEFIYNKGSSLGATAAISIEWPLTKRLFLSSSIRTHIHAYGPKRRERTVSTRNGDDRLDEFSTSQRYTIFHKDYQRGRTNNRDIPTEESISYYTFNSIGLQLGLIYYLKAPTP
ncbi:MAG: hypothetical protein AAFV25_12220 [Bacteroidota bacterium]